VLESFTFHFALVRWGGGGFQRDESNGFKWAVMGLKYLGTCQVILGNHRLNILILII
jgi:hypothetical protein